jgi:hypothetical protein
MTLEELKSQLRTISARYPDREQRARRVFIEERAAALQQERDREFDIRTEISAFFDIAYSAVSFCGSGQLALAFIRTGCSSHASRTWT